MEKSLKKRFTTFFIVLLMLLGMNIPKASQDTFAVPDSGGDSNVAAYGDSQTQKVSLQSGGGDTTGDTASAQNNRSGDDAVIEDPDIPLIDDPFNQDSRNSLQWWWIPILLIALIGNSLFIFFLLYRRRKRDDKEIEASR